VTVAQVQKSAMKQKPSGISQSVFHNFNADFSGNTPLQGRLRVMTLAEMMNHQLSGNHVVELMP
jgi:hypothetical protein